MTSQHRLFNSNTEVNEPFEIVHNARKNSKQLRSTAMKSRKNSTISLADQKQKKIKKKTRKFTQYLNENQQMPSQKRELSHGFQQRHSDFLQNPFLQIGSQIQGIQQKIKYEKEEHAIQEKQEEIFYFHDHEVEKGIFQGIGDENSLGRQFNFDYFNPQNYQK